MAELGSDPGFQSFLRTLEQRRTMVEAEKIRRLQALLARRDLEMAELDIREEQEGDAVDDDFEARGLFRSGGRLEDRADVLQTIGAQRARAEFNLAEDSALANREAAGSLANLATMRAQEEMSARQRIADREFAMAQQARAERLAAEERARWEEEQRRLQGIYDRQFAYLQSQNSAAASQPAARTYTTAPAARTPTRSAARVIPSTENSPRSRTTTTTRSRTLNWAGASGVL